MAMDKFFFGVLLNSYATLAKELGVSTAEQVRMWDNGKRKPSLESRLKMLDLLRQKRNALSHQIQELEALYPKDSWQ